MPKKVVKEVANYLNFVESMCSICCDLRVFLGVKFELKDLLCVEKLTFRNSGLGWGNLMMRSVNDDYDDDDDVDDFDDDFDDRFDDDDDDVEDDDDEEEEEEEDEECDDEEWK